MRKNIPFYPARTGINFSYFQLARRSFRFPSQLISQCFFIQLAQILPEEQVFCRAAPLGTPVWLCVVTDSEVVVATPGTDNDVLMPRVVVVVALVGDGMEAGLFSLKIISSFNDIILFNVPAS